MSHTNFYETFSVLCDYVYAIHTFIKSEIFEISTYSHRLNLPAARRISINRISTVNQIGAVRENNLQIICIIL